MDMDSEATQRKYHFPSGLVIAGMVSQIVILEELFELFP